jgi:hypothetical protein
LKVKPVFSLCSIAWHMSEVMTLRAGSKINLKEREELEPRYSYRELELLERNRMLCISNMLDKTQGNVSIIFA